MPRKTNERTLRVSKEEAELLIELLAAHTESLAAQDDPDEYAYMNGAALLGKVKTLSFE